MEKELVSKKEKKQIHAPSWQQVVAGVTAFIMVTSAAYLGAEKLSEKKEENAVIEILQDKKPYDENFEQLCLEAQNVKNASNLEFSEALENALETPRIADYSSKTGTDTVDLEYYISICQYIMDYKEKKDPTIEEQKSYFEVVRKFVVSLPEAREMFLDYAKDRCIESVKDEEEYQKLKEYFPILTIEEGSIDGKPYFNLVFSELLPQGNGLHEGGRIFVEEDKCLGSSLQAVHIIDSATKNTDFTDKTECAMLAKNLQKSIGCIIAHDKNEIQSVKNKNGNLKIKEVKYKK